MPALLESRRATAALEQSIENAPKPAVCEAEVWGKTSEYRYTRRRWHLLMRLVDWFGYWLFRACAAIGRCCGMQDSPRTAPLSILLVQLDHLGDAILTTAVLPALRREFPQARIEVLASPISAEVFRNREEIDCVWVCPRYRYSRGHGWLWPAAVLYWGLKLRGRFDTAIDIRGELPLALLLWLTGATRRLGWNAGGGGFLLTESPIYTPHRPEVDSRWAMFRLLGIEPQMKAESLPRWRPTGESLGAMSGRLEGIRVFGQPIYMFHLGSGMESKRWPARYWGELVRRLAERGPSTVILVGGEDDRPLARQVLQAVNGPGVTDWTGRTSVTELVALAEFADVFVGADSGPAHLAAAVGVATLVLFSGTNHAPQWQPRGRHVRVLQHAVACSPCHCESCPLADHPCMTGLSVDEVLRAVLEIQSEKPPEMRCRISA